MFAFKDFLMTENELTYLIRKGIFSVHKGLGPGLYESVYESALVYELRDYGLQVKTQMEIAAVYRGKVLDPAFRLDILVENEIVIEVKSAESIVPVNFTQVLTYLRFTNKKLGILVNFNAKYLKDNRDIWRIIHDPTYTN